eukprot:1159849-Pelagomonas_calceolata.AAC.3
MDAFACYNAYNCMLQGIQTLDPRQELAQPPHKKRLLQSPLSSLQSHARCLELVTIACAV